MPIKTYSEKAERPARHKRKKAKQEQKKIKTNVVEEQPETGQSDD